MFDYKKVLEISDFDGMKLEVAQSEKRVDIFGNKKGLLYLACRLIEFVEEDCEDCNFAEMNLDAGIDLTPESSSLCVFVESIK